LAKKREGEEKWHISLTSWHISLSHLWHISQMNFLPTATPVYAGTALQPPPYHSNNTILPTAPCSPVVPRIPTATAPVTFSKPTEQLLELRSETSRRMFLSSMGLVQGIQDEMIGSLSSFPIRHFILDNSGSMSTCDGHMHVISGRHEGFVECSRWKELTQSLEWLGQVAIGLAAPTEFRLINPASGVNVISLGNGQIQSERAQLNALTGSSPTGRTPICAAIRQVVASIAARADELRQNGQRAMVEIATDGVSTDGDLAAALAPLEQLPVWVVIRLCTDDEAVVDYWNSIDEQLELDLDVLDDLAGEAAEVKAVNPWMVYGESLHRLREWGSPNKLLDLLDETKFTATQAAEMVELILGKRAAGDLPPPALDLAGFICAVEQLQSNSAVGAVFDPLTAQRTRWFSARGLKALSRSQTSSCLGASGGAGCSIM
jgi:hypothetical protein